MALVSQEARQPWGPAGAQCFVLEDRRAALAGFQLTVVEMVETLLSTPALTVPSSVL